MSDAANRSGESTGAQEPSRAVQHTAPGVTGAKQAPVGAVTLSTGDVVSKRFRVDRYLGSSGGGVSYLCEDTNTGKPVVIKVLAMPYPGDETYRAMCDQVRIASRIQHRNLTNILGMGRVHTGELFVAMEFVAGQTLSSMVRAQRDRGQTPSIRDTFTVIAHVCNALEAFHDAMPHAVLTPYNIYIDKRGVVKVGNLAFARMAAEYQLTQGEGPFVDSIYVAPEVAEAPDFVSSAADLFSLGMITAEMLHPQGLPADRDEAKALAIRSASNLPKGLFQLISKAIGEDLAARPRDAATFREEFEKIARQMGADLTAAVSPGGLPVEPAVHEGDEVEEEEDLFDIPELAGLGLEASDPSNERYLVQKGGLDYGPFTREQVIEQLHADEIDEHTLVLDRITQDRIPLGEMDRFRADVEAYIPIREDRRRREAEARAEFERKVKKGGVGLLVAGIAFGIVVLTAQIVYYVMRPDPLALPIQEAFAEMDYKFLPPPKEFQAVAVDNDLLENIFNPRASEEEIERQIRKRRKRAATKGKSRGRKKGGAGGSGESFEVDMTAGAKTDYVLTDQDVNDVILANFGGLRSCILKELKSDPGFRGVTVQFFIRPTGTTGGVKIQESKYADRGVADCITSRFRSMKFPEHGGFNRGVTYPLRVQ